MDGMGWGDPRKKTPDEYTVKGSRWSGRDSERQRPSVYPFLVSGFVSLRSCVSLWREGRGYSEKVLVLILGGRWRIKSYIHTIVVSELEEIQADVFNQPRGFFKFDKTNIQYATAGTE